MIVKVNLSKSKEIEWSQYAIRFALGGLVTALAGILAAKFGPTVGGVFLAFPAIFPASLTLVEKTERDAKIEKGIRPGQRPRAAAALDTYGATLGSLALMPFAVLTWLFLARYSPLLVLLGATAVWTVCSVGMWAGLRRWRHRTVVQRGT